MTQRLAWLSCLALASVLATTGCGDDEKDNDGSGGDTGSGGLTSSGGTSSGGTSSGGTSSGGTSSGGTSSGGGSADPCDNPDNKDECDAWASSGHADKTAEAFMHWNEEDPAEVAATCAGCHTSSGFEQRISGDEVQAIPVGETVMCSACHNDAAMALTEVTFPSGKTVDADHSEGATCMHCHQGRASGSDITDQITGLAGASAGDDIPRAELRFTNVHYYAAAASLYGMDAAGGFEYDGKTYVGKNPHAESQGFNTCTGCHNQHSLEIELDSCTGSCHAGQAASGDPKDLVSPITSNSSRDELITLQGELMDAMQAYATATADVDSLCYSAAAYPYFFVDTDGNGECSDTEAVRDNAFGTWTPKLLKAGYNYQFALKDPGSFAHNPKYHKQIMIDSIEDLGGTASITRP